ncbi:hypothetical protein VNO77_17485 [Canavalia gladiata]|uniref:Uncharacterized protein n=1 Tax=Canavalia gladiata TaxID=3824 RepID=A0AAN9QIS9_CANGL
MEAGAFMLDVSSDEEEAETYFEEKGERSIDLDWINEFLDMSDEEPNEVVVLHEVNKHEDKSKSSISTPSAKSVDDDDEDEDDCVVLDGDPEKRVNSVEDSPTGSDELFVVGEKGQIACRDYPHARHLCVKFPYSSTPHERHCDQVMGSNLGNSLFSCNGKAAYIHPSQTPLGCGLMQKCHCYVCDSLAPCMKWGTGLSSTDHCHANDKSEMWETLRKIFRLSKTDTLAASTNYGTLGDIRNPQHNHILPLDITPLSPNSMLVNQTSRSTAMHRYSPVNLIMRTCSSPNSNLQTQISRPNTFPECSMAANFTIPYGTNHGRCQESGSTLVRKRYQSHSIPRQFLGVRNHAIQRVRGNGASSFWPQLLCSRMTPKGVGNAGVRSAQAMNHCTHAASGFSNHANSACKYDRYLAVATGFSNNRTCYGQNDIWNPQNFLYPHPSSEQNNLSSFTKYDKAYEAQAYCQSNHSQNLYAFCVQGNDAPSSNVVGLNRNQVLNEHQIGSQNENACGNIIQCGTTREYFCQQKPHDESQSDFAMKADFSGLDSSWVEGTSKNSESINISLSAKEGGAQVAGSTNFGSVDDIKQWLFGEGNSAQVGANGVLASQLNMPSPDLSTFDESMYLFDFESSWNCLAHV